VTHITSTSLSGGTIVCVTIRYALLPPTKEEIHVFARVCLSVCLLARLLKNVCMDLDEMLRVPVLLLVGSCDP